MNNIQKLISELEDDKEKAQSMIEFAEPDQLGMIAHYEGRVKAFSLCIHKLTLLLNTENENGGKKDG